MGSLELFSLLPFLLFALVAAGEIEELDTYVVHVQPKENHVFGTPSDRKEWHQSFLPDNDRLVHSYHHVASGFAARLTRRELDAVSAMPGFVAAVPDVIYRLQTTHTPQFLGLNTALGYRNPSVGSGDGVIIGVLDTGVFPNHPSFSGKGMPPPPAKWKGRCDFNASACNNKLIGARSFISEGSSSGGPPTDEEGHGTHTSSTAAGAVVPGAQVLGQANGTASGMAPRAHLAMYKVCSEDGCASVDILAGIDAAVSDGCDVISMSLGGESVPFYHDSIAVGTFAAAEKGIFVSMAAGNSGPNYTTLSNDAPWMLTVAASTMDRLISAQVILGDGLSFDGESVYQPDSVEAPLVYAGASSTPLAQFCGNGSLDGFDVKNKIVLCERGGDVGRVDKGIEVLRAGGAGMILTNEFIDGYSLLADAHVLPASHVSYAAGVEIKNYIKSTPNCTAKISFRGTVLGTSPAPAITSFSSRGPSTQNMDILKPDITGPGVSVLAAWPFKVGPPTWFNVSTAPTFNIISGTSMSTPHLAGIAALIKSKHPDWSPAAIKSAIMTTAYVTDRSGTPIVNQQHKPADFFAMGAGHVNPDKAVDPGLVYDTATGDYIGFLCGMYTDQQVSVIARQSVNCSTVQKIPQSMLNYPSISVSFVPDWYPLAPVIVERTVKYVGQAEAAMYQAHVDMPAGSFVNVTVTPSVLWFSHATPEQKFTVLVFPLNATTTAVQGAIRWVSETHTVRSPVSAMFPSQH
ncbi:subtilisin-like protease [Triticum dicoccoides]|uniref:subtilisin-like protease n=1 Tax=Triticum dicoccoides TaxID=85692 RepID=UPI00188F1377|nr:subtilisin-like protease [Triticum dicoccoides]